MRSLGGDRGDRCPRPPPPPPDQASKRQQASPASLRKPGSPIEVSVRRGAIYLTFEVAFEVFVTVV